VVLEFCENVCEVCESGKFSVSHMRTYVRLCEPHKFVRASCVEVCESCEFCEAVCEPHKFVRESCEDVCEFVRVL
jgi:hypothetical protein